MLIASLQMFDVIKGCLDTQSSRRRWQQQKTKSATFKKKADFTEKAVCQA
jgi:hypothetical protein